jgi:ribonucleotide reductase alpha subunit
MTIVHPDYSRVAARISVSNLHKQTDDSYQAVADKLYNYKDAQGNSASLLADDVYQIIQENHEKIQEVIDYKKDFGYDFFGFKTLERSYLLKVENKIVERP